MKETIQKIINAAWFPGIPIMIALVIFTLLVFFPPSSAPPRANTETGTLTVMVTGLRNSAGNLIVCLYTAGPFSELSNIALVREMGITGGEMTIAFSGVPFRDYAIFALHDENRNRIPDPSGADDAPREGMAFSNIDTPLRDVPDFEKARFHFNMKNLELRVHVAYSEALLR